MKKGIFLVIFLLGFSQLFAATSQINSESIIAYRTAAEYFDKLEYGKALKYAEDAILYRKQESEYEEKVLHNALTAKKVAAVGSNINDVLAVLEERGEKESISIINHYIKIKGVDFFDNSIDNLRAYIDRIKDYPEASRLIGDIYKLEGEYQFAESYYKIALKNADILDVPNEKYDILYTLAEISKLKGDFSEMEVRLLNVLVDDPCYKDKALFNSMMGTVKANQKKSVEKFFNLYRAYSYYCLNAYNELIQYYINVGEKEKALRLSTLSVITGFSKVYEILKLRNPEYEYSDLEDFFTELSYYPDVVEWGTKNNVWKSYYDFCIITNEMNYSVFSKELLTIISKNIPDDYWQRRAVLALSKMN